MHDLLREKYVDATLAMLRVFEAPPSRGSFDWIASALAHAPAAAADGPAQIAETALVRVDWQWAGGAGTPRDCPFWKRGSRRPSRLTELAAS